MDKCFEFNNSQYTLYIPDTELCKAFTEAKCCCEDIGQCITEIISTISGTSDYWKTSSAELLRERFAEDISSQEFLANSASEVCDILKAVIRSYRNLPDLTNVPEILADDILS